MEKGIDPMRRKLLLTAAVVAIALAPPIGIGTAEAHGGGFAGSGFRGGGFRGGGFRGGHFRDHGFLADENFGATDFGLVVSSVVIIQATMDMELAT